MDGETSEIYQLNISKEPENLYQRHEGINAQIVENSNFTDQEILKKLDNLASEVLVYLMRRRFRENTEAANLTYRILIKRIFQITKKYKNLFDSKNDLEDYVQDILLHLAKEISEKKDESIIFAEANFKSWVVRCGANFYRSYDRVRKQNKSHDSIDRENEEGFLEEPSGVSFEFLPVDKQLIFKEVVVKMAPNFRELFYLHYILGIQVDSKDSTVPTLAKHFGKTPRTINDWLRKIEHEFSSKLGK